LSAAEKHQKLVELKTSVTSQIITLKKASQVVIEQQQKLAINAKIDYRRTKNNAQVKTKLKTVQASYLHKLSEAKKTYQKRVVDLKEANKTRHHQFDKPTSQGQIAAMQGFVGTYHHYKSELKNQQVYPGTYLNQLAEKITLM